MPGVPFAQVVVGSHLEGPSRESSAELDKNWETLKQFSTNEDDFIEHFDRLYDSNET